jgi:hypothetical protein
MYRLKPSRAVLLALLPALVCCLSGCGGGGKYDVSGKVTFKGQPVPAGKIYFIPDGSKGNSGPTGYAVIQGDGTYNTSSRGGKPTVGGPMIVAIEGWDPKSQGKTEEGDTSGEKTVAALFPRYEKKVALPSSNSTQDFEVPAEAATPKNQPEMPGIVP